MEMIQANLRFVLTLSRAQAVINRKFDGKLSAHGVSLNDFIILFYLNEAPGSKLRRVDLAEKIGVTASGVTRILAPMEKLGWVGREADERDARISYAVLLEAGRRLFEESLKTAEYAANETLSVSKIKKMELLNEAMAEIFGRI